VTSQNLTTQDHESGCGQNCSQAEHRLPGRDEHVVLAVWNSASGDYRVGPPNMCLATWATAGVTHAAGEICGGEATQSIGDVQVCQHHHDRAQEWIHGQVAEKLGELDRYDMALDQKRKSLDAEIDKREVRRKEALKKARSADSIIYYVRRDDGLIKIGTSTVFRNRLSQLRMQYGELDVLLVHRGDRDDERELHGQFRIWRERGEWFHPGRPLVAHIRLARISEGSKLRTGGAVPFGVLESLTRGALSHPPPRKPRRQLSA
jgi:hypothetical protein